MMTTSFDLTMLKIGLIITMTLSLSAFGWTFRTGRVEANTANSGTGGAEIYANNCARCHGTDGRAQTAKGRQVQAVDLTSDDWKPDEGRDTRIVTKGKGSMPSFKNKLSAAEIQSVVQYIRRFKQ
jgi:mono/diheme cytochrome c family protein